LTHFERADIYADSAEPDRIEEINRAGWTCYPANKDVKMGIDVVKRQVLYITKDSLDLIKEIRNWSYRKDRDGNVLEEPSKVMDHLMDSLRYVAMGQTERWGYATASPGASKVTDWSW
jgi:phage terminase large subunit